jgi:flagellin-specific chaperone FliS
MACHISGSPRDVVFTHQQHVELLFETVISTVAAARNSIADERSDAVHSAV